MTNHEADCFQAYTQCAQGDSTGTLAQDLLCMLALIRCSNAHLYGSVGEHRVARPGEADVTGEAVLERDVVLKVLEMHAEEVQAYAKRARSGGGTRRAVGQPGTRPRPFRTNHSPRVSAAQGLIKVGVTVL
jgi:hypothetical protein